MSKARVSALMAYLCGGAEPSCSDDDREAFEERAAIMEYDGGMTREEAERLAAELLRAVSA